MWILIIFFFCIMTRCCVCFNERTSQKLPVAWETFLLLDPYRQIKSEEEFPRYVHEHQNASGMWHVWRQYKVIFSGNHEKSFPPNPGNMMMFWRFQQRPSTQTVNPIGQNISEETKTFYVLAPDWHDTWNPSLCKTGTCLYSTETIAWVMMGWRRKETRHQQPWYLLCWNGLNRSPHVKG